MASIADIFLKAVLQDDQLQVQAVKAGDKAGQTLGQRISSSLRSGLSQAASGLLPGLGLGAGLAIFQSAGQAVHQVTAFMSESIDAAKRLQAANVLLDASIRQNDKSWTGNTDSIEKAIKAGEQLGFTSLEQRDALRVLVAQTRNLNDALTAERVAMDLARLRGIDLSTATLLVGKAYDGNVGALKRFGIQIAAGTKGIEALNAIEKVAGGQAEAFSKTAEGAAARQTAAWEALQEQIGTKLLPVVTAITTFTAEKLIPALSKGADVVGNLAGFLGPVLSPIVNHLGQLFEVLALILAGKILTNLVQLGAGFVDFIQSARGGAEALGAVSEATDVNTIATDANTEAIAGNAAAGDVAAASIEAGTVAVTGATTAVEANTAAAEANTVKTEAATTATKEYAISLRTIGIAALIAIPIIGQLQDALANWTLKLGYANTFGKEFATVIQAVGGNQGAAAIAFAGLTKAAKDQNQPLADVTQRFLDLVNGGADLSDALSQVTTGSDLMNRELADSDRAMLNESASVQGLTADVPALQQALQGLADGTLPKLKDALDKGGATLVDAGAFWGAKLKSGETVYASSADELAAKLPDAVKTASDRAAAIAAQTPGKIAAALLGAQDQLLTDANQIATAMNKALQLKVDVANTRKQIVDQLAEIRKGGKAATAEQQIQLNTQRLQLAAYLLEQNPKSREAANLLKNALIGATPATKLAIQQMLLDLQTETQAQTPAIEQLMQRLGLSLPEAITQHTADVSAAMAQQVARARDALIAGRAGLEDGARQAGAAVATGVDSPANRTRAHAAGADLAGQVRTGLTAGNPYAGGYAIGASWVQGIVDGAFYVYLHQLLLMSGKIKNLLGGSLPTEGPLQHPETGGHSIGSTWVGAIAKAIRAFQLPNPLAAAMPSFAYSPAFAEVGAGSVSTVVNHFHFTGVPPKTDTAREISDGIARLMPHALIGG